MKAVRSAEIRRVLPTHRRFEPAADALIHAARYHPRSTAEWDMLMLDGGNAPVIGTPTRPIPLGRLYDRWKVDGRFQKDRKTITRNSG